MLISLIFQRFILDATCNRCLNRMAILPLSTRRLYFGIHTKCTCSRCFVCAPVQYSAMARLCQKIPPLRQLRWLRYGQPFIPELKSSGFSGRFDKMDARLQSAGMTKTKTDSGYLSRPPIAP